MSGEILIFGWGDADVGCSVTVVKKKPTNCATTRQTTRKNLGAILFRGGTVKNIYLGRNYVPAGALLCSTGVLSDFGASSGCNVSPRKAPSFSVSGVVEQGGQAIGGLASNIGVQLASDKVAVIRNATILGKRASKEVHLSYKGSLFAIGGMLLYANSRAMVPPVGNLSSMSC